MDYKNKYDNVMKEINDSLIILFRLFGMKLTERGKEWRMSDNYYESSD